jgi:hypothetical protein
MPMDFLISPEGKWLVAGSPEANARIGYEDPDFDATGFAVRNQGFVQVKFRGAAAVEIRLHPDQVAPGALASLEDRSATFGDATVELVYLTDHWVSERLAGIETTKRRIAELCAPFLASGRPRYVATPLDVRPLYRDYDNPLKLLLQKWRVSFRRFSDNVVPFAVQHGIFSRMMIVGVKKTDPDPVVRYVGEGFSVLWGEEVTFRAVGQKFVDLPDKEYMNWACQFYKETASTGEPRFDVVDAVIPNAPRGPHIRYERLLLPWTTPSGEVLVTLSSQTLQYERQSLAKPFYAAAAEPANDPARNLSRSTRISAPDMRMSARSMSPPSGDFG